MAKHYVIIDGSACVIRSFSDEFEQPSNNAICINEDGGRHFELNGSINPSLINEFGIPRYRLIAGKVIERTQEEMDESIAEIHLAPSIEDRTTALESALLELILGGVI